MTNNQSSVVEREAVDEEPNPLGLDGIEFIGELAKRPTSHGKGKA